MKTKKHKPINLEQAQVYANKRYAFRKINEYSAPFSNTVEEVLEKFPELDEETAKDIVFEASVQFEEQD